MATSPTQLSLKKLRKEGYLTDVVEKWIPGANIRRDLYGFIDILGISDTDILAVQATTDSHLSERVHKIEDHENLAAVRKAGIRIECHGWSKKNGRWQCRVVDLS